MSTKRLWKTVIALVFVAVIYSEGWRDRIKLHDVNHLTLRRGHLTHCRRSGCAPQMKCVGGSAGCSAFVPKVVHCHNRGSYGHHVQWDCKTDMDNEYRFGKTAVNCEGYDHPEDPYILKGSCGLEYTIDHADRRNAYQPGTSHGYHHGYYGYGQHQDSLFSFPCSMSTLFMWGIIALIVYFIYTTCYTGRHCHRNTTDSTQNASEQSTYSTPPPPYTPPGYTEHKSTTEHTYSTPSPPYSPPEEIKVLK